MKFESIYITYDGICEPISESQILPLINSLSKNRKIILISLERKVKKKILNIVKNNKNILWFKYNYFSNKLVFLNFIILAYLNIKIFYLLKKHKIKIIHLRSLIPYISIMIPSLFYKVNIIYDMRGFWIQEKIDRYNWNKNSIVVKTLKKIEIHLLKKSKKIICLTENSIKILSSKYNLNINKFTKIPTTVDLNLFKKNQNIKNKLTNFCYLGTTKYAYDFNLLIKFFIKLKTNNISYNLFIISKDKINTNILKNIGEDNYKILDLEREDVIKKLNSIDFGIFFLKNNKSVAASYPTKIGEFMSMGIPIICNKFNTDFEKIFDKKNCFINYEQDSNILNVIDAIKSYKDNHKISSECISFAKEELNLENSNIKYKIIYDKILNE